MLLSRNTRVLAYVERGSVTGRRSIIIVVFSFVRVFLDGIVVIVVLK